MIEWRIEPGLRCDIVMYAAPNMSGKRSVMQCFPAGNRKGGKVAPAELKSLVIRAPLGTRVTLRTSASELWEELPWRTVRLLPGHIVPASRSGGMPGVRIPDLDRLDEPHAKSTSRDLLTSYPRSVGEADGWTFGQPGDLKGRVRVVTISREGVERALTPVEQVARAILEALPPKARSEVRATAEEAVADALRAAKRRDADARLADLRSWLDAL